MIDTREKLKQCLKKEKAFYISSKSRRTQVVEWFVKDPCVRIWKYQKILRYTEYFCNQKGILKWLIYPLLRKEKNRRGLKLGLEIVEGSFGEGLTIFHSGNIVVNGFARIGKDCKLHGANCIGNDGITLDTPVIGDRVDIGAGASIIGGITIADDITVGAGAVVTKSFTEPGIVIAGIPARKVKKKNEYEQKRNRLS